MALVFLMLMQGVAIAHASSGRAASMELSTQRQEWLSNETVELVASISNLPFGTQLFYEWELRDESGTVLLEERAPFQATGTVTEIAVDVKHFYNGDTFYRTSFTVKDQYNATMTQDSHAFAVFHNSVMPQRGNLLAFGDSLSDMGNAKNSILNVPDVPPYWQGRFSNGQVWLEYVSDAYGLQTSIG